MRVRQLSKSGNNDYFTEHVVACAMNREECDLCDATLKTKAYLSKHLKGKHVKPASTNIPGDKQNASMKQHDDTNV